MCARPFAKAHRCVHTRRKSFARGNLRLIVRLCANVRVPAEPRERDIIAHPASGTCTHAPATLSRGIRETHASCPIVIRLLEAGLPQETPTCLCRVENEF